MFGKDKLDIWFYIRRLVKSETPAEYIKNNSNMGFFVNRRIMYEYEQFLKRFRLV
jgi:hypothetical protein